MEFIVSLLMVGSAACFIFGAVNFFWLSKEKRITRRLLEITASVVVAVLLLQMSTAVTAGERVFPSTILIDTMQVFSLDASYQLESDYLSSPLLESIVTVYKAVLYSVAPIVGGAVIYDVLSGISPDISMELAKRKRLYIFSEINEKTLCLAESIYKTAPRRKTAIVFTDSYLDKNEESESELFFRASDIHAICLRSDILHCSSFHKAKACSFFLMDKDENGNYSDTDNIITLKSLLVPGKEKWNTEKECHIFMFSDDNETIQNISAIRNNYEKQLSDGRGDSVRVHAVRDLAQTACMLMKNEPLFKAVDGEGKPLRVLIVGNNTFSREMFKTVFWCGQLLDHPLYITVAYSPEGDAGSDFEKWLDRACPELVKSCTRGDDCLLFREGEYSEPYATLSFVKTDIKSIGTAECLSEQRGCCGSGESCSLRDHDYFIVMDESDETNLKLAFEVQRSLAQLSDGSRSREQIIAARIENDELADILKLRYREIREANAKNGTDNSVELYAFGSVRERLSWKNITGDGVYLAETSREKKNALIDRHGVKGRVETYDEIYNEWANVARAFHVPYKMFSVGVDPCTADSMAQAKLEYCRRLTDDTAVEELTWLEHRRWVSFTRTQGYVCPKGTVGVSLSALNGTLAAEDHTQLTPYCVKNMFLHLHPCLVESERYVSDKPDFLDVNNWMRKMVKAKAPIYAQEPGAYLEGRDTGLKSYDRPDGKNSPALSEEELCLILPELSGSTVGQMHAKYPWLEKCRHTEYRDMYWADLVMGFMSIERNRKNAAGHTAGEKCSAECEVIELGKGSAEENALCDSGKLKRVAGGYEVFSREAMDGKGESARPGDYIKLDSGGWPYPVHRDKFLKTHELVNGRWVQTSQIRELWLSGDPVNDTISFVISTRRLTLKPDDREHYFNAYLHGTLLSAREDAAVVFYSVTRDAHGQISDAAFDFVARDEFDKSYTY